jgi:diguanylate cyclase (GGDEF)-like protein
MDTRSPVRLYCAAVFAAGCVCVALLARIADFGFIARSPLTFAVLFAGVLFGELLPIKIPHRKDEEITLSASFAMALLVLGGLGPALIAQGLASIVQDRNSHKPWWRVRFNVGQYALSLGAACILIRLISITPHAGLLHADVARQLLAMGLGAGAFFLINAGLVGVAVALYQGIPVLRYLRTNASFVLVTGGLMLLISPIVLAAATYSAVIVPLCLAPVVAMYTSISRGARSEHAARHDSLTGLPNRAAFQDAVKDALGAKNEPACILLMDLDRFKEINDTLGHRYGDLLLVEVARRIREAIAEEVAIARLGGDEFAIVGPGRSCEGAVDLAELILAAMRAPFELEQMVVDAQASIGIALFPEHGHEVETLVQKADVAMYKAKESHADWAIYDERHDRNSPAKLALTAELRTAVQGEEMVVWYQPELDLHSGQVLAVEALVRWEHPRQGVLAPSEFVRLAEQTNMIKPLTHRVIKLALEQVSRWRAVGIDLAVAVNISAQVLVDRSLTEHVMGALQLAGVAPHNLKLEVTESTLMSDQLTARTVLRELSALGVEIAIDDFGTGYSSLAYLADLPVSEVKIDRSFVSRMATGSSEKIIVASTIDLAHHLGLRAVAEGVEDPLLLPELRLAGCDAAQGYGISRPLPSLNITRWLLDFSDSGRAWIASREDEPLPRVLAPTARELAAVEPAIERAA